MNDFAFLLFTTQKYSSFNPPYFPKRTLKFFLNSIPACSEDHDLAPFLGGIFGAQLSENVYEIKLPLVYLNWIQI